jgi:antitoxin PrlF
MSRRGAWDYTPAVGDWDSRMPTRITVKGQVTLPKKVREALRLSPGDAVEFQLNPRGEVIVHKAQAPAADAPGCHRERRLPPRATAQMRRRAAELLALLRGLD